MYVKRCFLYETVYISFLLSTEFHGNTASDNRPDTPDHNTDKQTTASNMDSNDMDELKCNLMNQLNLIDDTESQDRGIRDYDSRNTDFDSRNTDYDLRNSNKRNTDLRDHRVIPTDLRNGGLRL